jgi:hypothetical protein
MAAIQKDSLLINTPSPRIIFIGGSNLSFGLNSQEIKDSLHLNPVNMGIHSGIGMKFVLENTLQYVNKGDIIVIVLENAHFFRDWDCGSEELFRSVFDVDKSKIKLWSIKQIYNCYPYTGKYILSKTRKYEYVNVKEDDVYGVNSFNKYGDVDAHWNLENRHEQIEPHKEIDTTQYNHRVIKELKLIADKFKEKGCVPLFSYSCLQEASFNNRIDAIRKIEKEYQRNGFVILGAPERYMMPDSLLFNTPEHVNKKGVDRRTKFLIEDLKTALIDSLEILK